MPTCARDSSFGRRHANSLYSGKYNITKHLQWHSQRGRPAPTKKTNKKEKEKREKNRKRKKGKKKEKEICREDGSQNWRVLHSVPKSVFLPLN